MSDKRITISDEGLKAELIKLFESGNTSKAKCSEVIRSRFKLQLQRFYKAYAVVHTDWAKLKDQAQSEQVIENEKKGLKKAILKKSEALELLSKTAKGIARKVGSTTIIPSYSESTAAIRALAEIQGWNMPKKVDVTSKGKKLQTSANQKVIKVKATLKLD